MSFKAMRKTDVVFIRHGESANNVTYETVRVLFGDDLPPEQYEIELAKLHSPDCLLSPKGVKQVEQLGKYLAAGGLSKTVPDLDTWKLFTSPMNRCLLTAKEVGIALKKRVTVVPFLFESDGCYETLPDHTTRGLPGSTAVEVHDKYPMFDCLPGMENGYFHLDKKETRRQFLERSQQICDWLWALHDQSHVERGFKTGMIITAHGNLIQAVITLLLQAKGAMMLTHDNTGFAHIQLWSRDDGSERLPAVLYTNRVDHLRENPELIAGGAVFEDHWIQEFMEPMDG
jgi:broad specificity phosphatase PhoE